MLRCASVVRKCLETPTLRRGGATMGA